MAYDTKDKWLLPDSVRYQAAYAVTRGRKLPDGRFEGQAALYFMGRLQRRRFHIAETRAGAIRGVERALRK